MEHRTKTNRKSKLMKKFLKQTLEWLWFQKGRVNFKAKLNSSNRPKAWSQVLSHTKKKTWRKTKAAKWWMRKKLEDTNCSKVSTLKTTDCQEFKNWTEQRLCKEIKMDHRQQWGVVTVKKKRNLKSKEPGGCPIGLSLINLCTGILQMAEIKPWIL